MTQLELALIPHEVEITLINQRAIDGYVNATAMCRAVGKKLGHYLENKTTKEFLAELSSDIGIPIPDLVQIVSVVLQIFKGHGFILILQYILANGVLRSLQFRFQNG